MEALWSYLLAAMLFAGGGAVAHDDALRDAARGPHGGQLRMAGSYRFELVTSTEALSVYVTDHAGAKVATKGVTGSATIMSGQSEVRIPLRAARNNLVKGSGRFALASETTVTVWLAFPGQGAEIARFAHLKTAARVRR